MGYPLDRAGRRARRREIRDWHIARAEVDAARDSRSMVCADYHRHDRCLGAANCLCECHDPEGEG